MKKSYLIILLSLSLFSFIINPIQASHYMGGEITWQCIPSGSANAGKYIFTMKVYRECAGIQFGTTQTLSTNSPAGSISLTEISGWPKDISPHCNSNPNFSHITCTSAITPNEGAVEEHIYKSQPVELNGVPPTTGWLFYWGSCCRNPSTNVMGQPSWRLRAIMYPYNNQNMYPCFDNSPTFAESPQTVFCAGYPGSFNYYAKDEELDVLNYEWGEPLLSTGAPLSPYSTGYSYLSPLPDTSQHPNNIAAKVNSNTGWVTFKSYTTGAFVTSIKVTSFKNGIKMNEIWRDLQVIVANCGVNTTPVLSMSGAYGNRLGDTIFVEAGDTVNFNISASNFSPHPNGALKFIDLRAYGIQFGSFVPSSGGNPPTLSESSGCVSPPCATLSPAHGPGIPLADSIGVQTNFRWITDCYHKYTTTGSLSYKSDYRFTFIAKDDFCPVPARVGASVVIKVLQKRPPEIIVNNVHYNYTQMVADLSWKKYLNLDSSFIAYDIYHANSYNGPYTLVDSILNPNQIVYSHNIGVANEAYYYLKLRTIRCFSEGISVNSDTLSLNITAINSNPQKTEFELYQNRPNPAKNTTTISYYIDRYSKGNFILLDISGRIIKEQEIEASMGMNELELNTSELPNGIYYYKFTFNNKSKTKKLIIMR